MLRFIFTDDVSCLVFGDSDKLFEFVRFVRHFVKLSTLLEVKGFLVVLFKGFDTVD